MLLRERSNMRFDKVAIFAALFSVLISFGLSCLGVLFFALACGFEWNIFLCLGVWMALMALRWIVGSNND